MKTREKIYEDRDIAIRDYVGSSSSKYLNKLLLEVLLDIRDQNQQILDRDERELYVDENGIACST